MIFGNVLTSIVTTVKLPFAENYYNKDYTYIITYILSINIFKKHKCSYNPKKIYYNKITADYSSYVYWSTFTPKDHPIYKIYIYPWLQGDNYALLNYYRTFDMRIPSKVKRYCNENE